VEAVEDILTMSQKELKRLHIIRKAIDKRIKQREAAEVLGLSQRQVRRLVKRVREESDKGIIHRLRGIKSHRAIADAIKQKALSLCRGIYTGFNPTFASEKLFERNKVKLSRETLRQWFIAEGIAYEKRKARPHRKWRPRKAHCGEMVQMDGSHHDWFEGRRESCVLMGYIDDASSRVYARFCEYEGTMPAMSSFKLYALKYGLPQSIYLDRHPTYKGSKKPTIEDELLNRESLSQFGSALEELSVHLIHAQSAPAKGRVERLFKTFQDRLIKEMRLKGLKSIAEGNEFLSHYLPIFNKRFNVAPLQDEDLHRPLPKGIELDKILSVKTPHALRNDFTVAHEGKLYQVEDNIRTKEVIAEERINGSLFITYKGRALRYREITQRLKRTPEPRKPNKPRPCAPAAMDNPWRAFRLPGSHQTQIDEKVFAGAL
jgi:DNA-binding Lrp family transcriptional regulator